MKKYFFFSFICIVLAVLPSLHIFPSLIIYDEKRLFQVVLLLLAGVLFVRMRSPHLTPRGEGCSSGTKMGLTNYVHWGVAIFSGLCLLSLWFNGGWYRGLQELSLYGLLFIFLLYSATVYLQNPVQFEKGILFLLLLFGGLYALKFFIGYGMYLLHRYPVWPGQRYQATTFGFVNVRFFNQIQVWTLPLFVIWGSGILSKRLSRKLFPVDWLFLFLASLWWCLIIESAGRGATLSLLVAPCIILVLFKEQSHRYVKRYLGAFFMGVVLKFVLFDILAGGGITKSLARGGTGRLERWRKVIFDIIDKPLLGFGPMSYASIANRYHVAHPHNSILQIAYEFGIPAMIIVVCLVLFGLYKWFKQSLGQCMLRPYLFEGHEMDMMNTPFIKARSSISRELIRSPWRGTTSNWSIQTLQSCRDNMNLRVGISTALVAGLGYSLFSGVIVMPLSQLWMVLIASWVLGIYAENAGGKSKFITNLPDLSDMCYLRGELTIVIAKAVILLAILFLSYSLVIDVPQLRQNQRHYLKKYSSIYHPRFWQQGLIGPYDNP